MVMREDRLVDSATISGSQPMDRAGILNTLIQCVRKDDFHLKQSTSTSRLQELGVKWPEKNNIISS
uniref:Uncharacterized protein n=1 Tax=Arion vulgaris TaxID=1028688 RepID=A0A0B7BCC1_9EUPU